MKKKNILIKNIYYMLAYAFQALHLSVYEDVAAEEFEEIHNLFAAILAKGIGFQLKQGLYREYRNCGEELTVVRGKIDLPGTIKKKLAHERRLSCEFDEFSENNLLNQILKTTALFLSKNAKVAAVYKDDLKKKLLFFSHVDTLGFNDIKWDSIRFGRGNQTYRMLIGICWFLMEGLLLTTEGGGYRLSSVLDEQKMCRLFEKFILEYYRRHFPDLSVNPSRIPWALDDCSGAMLPAMQSDIQIQKGNTVLIIDAKYYAYSTQVHFEKHIIHSNNLYQIFTYVKNRDYSFADAEHKVSGMLLYARTEEEIQPDQVYQMHGNKISVRTLNLNLPFSEIAGQLDAIAEEYFPCSALSKN